MTPDLPTRVREAYDAAHTDNWPIGVPFFDVPAARDAALAAVIAVVQEDRTREIVEFVGPHFMGAHVRAGVVAGAITREFGGTTHD